jgi:hypothetical protein
MAVNLWHPSPRPFLLPISFGKSNYSFFSPSPLAGEGRGEGYEVINIANKFIKNFLTRLFFQ